MVTTTSIAADHEAKRQRLSFEKAKVVNVSIIVTASHTLSSLINGSFTIDPSPLICPRS
jgi:hypothetical protein